MFRLVESRIAKIVLWIVQVASHISTKCCLDKLNDHFHESEFLGFSFLINFVVPVCNFYLNLVTSIVSHLSAF